MAKFEFVKIADGSVLDYSTPSVVCEKTVIAKVKVPLWTGVGERIPLAELANAGLQLRYVPDQSAARVEYEKITKLYNADSVFPTRVTELKAFYDELGVAYTATTEMIEEALNVKFPDDVEAKTTYYARFNAALLNVKINYQAASRAAGEDFVDDFTVYRDFPALVKWLPGTYEESEIPAVRHEEIITTPEREQEAKDEMAHDAELAEQAAQAAQEQ